MSELFKNDDMNQLFFDITLTAKQKSMIIELVKMNQEVIGSKVFGYVLYDNGTFPVMTNIDRDFFAENYMAILTAMSKAGVYDSYTYLIKQVLGDGALIRYFTPRPRHLKIHIGNVSKTTSKILASGELWLSTSRNLGLLATKSISDFTLTQLRKVLEILANPSGTYLTFDFSPFATSVDISPKPEQVTVGDTIQFVATVNYSDGTQINSTDSPGIAEFSSSNSSVALIDISTGECEFIGEGGVIILAKVTSDGITISDGTDMIVEEANPLNTFTMTIGYLESSGYYGAQYNDGDGSYRFGDLSNTDWLVSDGTQGITKKMFFTGPNPFDLGFRVQLLPSVSYTLWNGWDGLSVKMTDSLGESIEFNFVMSGTSSGSYSFDEQLGESPVSDWFMARSGQNVEVKLSQYIQTKED